MNLRTSMLAWTICCLSTLLTWADVPHYINYQGTLTDTSGNPITGTRSIQFSIYADSTYPLPFWTEYYPSVDITDGLFRVSLGSVTPLPPSLFNSSTRWLGIRVAPDLADLAPRQRIVSVPYSLRTEKADSADYAYNAYYADEAGEAGTAYNAVSATYADTADYARTAAPDSDWTISGSNIYRTTGNVGIGTTNPGYKLQVAGQAISGFSSIASGGASTVSGGYNNKARGNYSVVAGGGGAGAADSNSAIGNYSAIGGGKGNTASWDGATVSGGGYNKASGWYSVIAGGGGSTPADSNSASGQFSTIGGGNRNVAISECPVISGGHDNFASYGSTVGGGGYNKARGTYSVIAGGGWNVPGDSNSASGDFSTIGGGCKMTASGWATTVSGGFTNTANGVAATVSGGNGNIASGDGSIVSGGSLNKARGDYSVVAGGGGAPADSNSASGDHSVIGGGFTNTAIGLATTVSGGQGNTASLGYATVSGGYDNTATYPGCTVSGGMANLASNNYATIGGGYENIASGDDATVSGGRYNNARGFCSVIAGGGGDGRADSNSATGDYSAIGGGRSNTTSGNYSAIPGGAYNTASGTNSFATGKWVTAGPAANTFALGVGLSLASPLVNNTANSLMVGFGATTPTLFVGGASQYVGIKTSAPETELHVEGTITVDQKIEADDAGGLEIATDEGTTRIKLNDNGNVGIGTTAPGTLLHAYQATGNPTLKIESDAGAPQMNLDGTDAQGTYAMEFREAGAFKASLGWDSDNDHFFIYQTRNAIAVDNGNVGINTTTPTAQLDVNGTTKLGSSGTIFNEIREITGTLSSTGTQSTFSLPSGYTSTNTRVISIEFSYATNYWMGIGYPITNRQFGYLLWGTSIVIDHQENGYFNDKPIRILLMKIG